MAGIARGTGPKVSVKRQNAGSGQQSIENEILRGIPTSELDVLLPKMEISAFPARAVLTEAAKPIENCYFLNGGVVSIIHVMTDGRSIEVGLTGSEGFIGLSVIVGCEISLVRSVVQIAATGHRISVENLKSVLQTCPVLERNLHRYSQELSIQTIQIAACNRLHSVDKQLSRWLLMTQDRVGKSSFPLTQDFISHMLGTRRASVSVAASALQKRGLITYTRGQVTIQNRSGLEQASCECYGEINKLLEAWGKVLQLQT
ncbi:MAG TPA: Crp/Fnr family transcriptional regulator [Candidatus Saccharimonadales bacterium]|jgi:CRP-like cAMP-binding protein|nr:Crp/Fnr family transcriptional regulator [Candidatus Saccharimonadales bacterium]